ASQPSARQAGAARQLRPVDAADDRFDTQLKAAFRTHDPGAMKLLRFGLQQGYPSAFAEAGAIRLESGDTARGMMRVRAAAEAGKPSAMTFLGLDALNAGRTAEGQAWILRAAQHGDEDALSMCQREKLSC